MSLTACATGALRATEPALPQTNIRPRDRALDPLGPPLLGGLQRRSAAVGIRPARRHPGRLGVVQDQVLLNIVKLRSMDAPVYFEVQQILAGYALESSASVGWTAGGAPTAQPSRAVQ